MNNDRIEVLLTEIRDSQRQLLDEYRRVANEALALQKQAVAQQATAVQAQGGHLRLYKVVIGVTLVVLFPLIGWLAWLLAQRL